MRRDLGRRAHQCGEHACQAGANHRDPLDPQELSSLAFIENVHRVASLGSRPRARAPHHVGADTLQELEGRLRHHPIATMNARTVYTAPTTPLRTIAP